MQIYAALCRQSHHPMSARGPSIIKLPCSGALPERVQKTHDASQKHQSDHNRQILIWSVHQKHSVIIKRAPILQPFAASDVALWDPGGNPAGCGANVQKPPCKEFPENVCH